MELVEDAECPYDELIVELFQSLGGISLGQDSEMNVLSQHAQAPHFSFTEELDNFDEDPEGPYDEQFESLEEESRRNDVPNELIELRQRLQSLKRGQPPPTTVEGLSEGIQPDVLRELHHDGLESQVNLLKFHILVASPKKDLVGSS